MQKILCFVLYFELFYGYQLEDVSQLIEQNGNISTSTQDSSIFTSGDFSLITSAAVAPVTNRTHNYSKWTPWSRCEYCFQRRMRTCITPKCKKSKIYEERPCAKKRCRRKRRRKGDGDFRVVQVEDSMMKVKASHSHMWKKWSQWSQCSRECRTYRTRICKKPERCKKRQQRQNAFCYHENTKCEQFVLNLIDINNNKNRRITNNEDPNKYQYNTQENAGSVQHNALKIPRCGRPRKQFKMLKIIGGTEAKRYRWPWHVAVINRYREIFCAGTLIASKWIVTAGHCIRSYLRIRLNEHDLTAIDGRELEMTVQKIFLHPRFNYHTVDNDIALLRLPRPVKLPPVCLPSVEPETHELCSIMGWGKVNNSHEFGTSKLQEAKIPVVEWDLCAKAYKRYILTQNMFCAGWASGKADTCAGDSGGGLMCPPKNATRSKGYSIQGITSFGDGCGRKNKYGIYTKVFNYLGWINYVMETYS